METRNKTLLKACTAVAICCSLGCNASHAYDGSAVGPDFATGETFENFTDYGNWAGFTGGVYAGNQAINSVNNTFKNNTNTKGQLYGLAIGGGAIYTKARAVTIRNGVFESNRSTSTDGPTGGGAIMVAGGNDGGTITDTKFFSNSAALDGGALYLNRAKDYIISGDEALESSIFRGNTAGNVGGAIYIDDESVITINNTLFETNQAVNGGAIYIDGSTLNLDNVKFLTNSANRGGAIFVGTTTTSAADEITLNINNTVFESNNASDGAAIYLRNADFETNHISGSTFKGNKATTRGGAVFVENSSLTIENSRFEGNEAANRGGAIVFEANKTNTPNPADANKTLEIINTDFIGNKTGQNSGGAIYINASLDNSVHGNKVVKIISNDGKTHEFTGNVHNINNVENGVSNAIYIDQGKVELLTEGDGSKLLFNDGIKGANPSIGSSTPTQANSIVSVNGDVTFNNKVESVSLSVNGGILTLNELNNTYLPIDETKKAPVPILENVDLTLYSGTLNMQNGVIDTLNIRHFNAANPNGEVKLALDADLANGESDLFNVDGEIVGTLNFDAEHVSINVIKNGSSAFKLFNRGSDTLSIIGGTVVQFTDEEKYSFTVGEDGLINVKRDTSGGLMDAITADGIREFKLNPAKDMVLTESIGAMGGEYLKLNIVGQDLNAKGNSGIIVGEGQRLELVNIGTVDGKKSAHGFASETSGAVVDNSGKLTVNNSYFKNNSTKASGAVINNNAKAEVIILDSSFENNKAEQNGGAINNIGGKVTITAANRDVLFAGNTAGGKANDIYMESLDDDLAVVTFDGSKTITLNGGIAGNGLVVKNGTGTLILAGDNSNYTGNVFFNGGETRLLDNAQYFVAANTTFDNGGMLNLINNNTNDHINFGNLNLKGNGRLGIDVNMKNGLSDTIAANSVTGDGMLIIDKVNILPDIYSTAKTLRFNIIETDKSGNSPLFGKIGVNPNGGEAMGPIFKYGIGYDENSGQMLLVGKSGKTTKNYNPAIMTGSVGALAGGYLSQLNSYDMAFNNMDMQMLMSKEQRAVMKYGNKYALSDGKVQAPIKTQYDERGAWFKPYSTFEKVGLHNGPKVSNVGYGAFFGGDSQLKELGHGFDGMFSVYAGYNGSHQAYNGNSIYQNGGHLGVSGIAYKGNFFTGITANVGASVGEASTMYGHEDFTMLMAGVAAKTGYNWELADGKFIVQPNYLMSYSFVNTFDYRNAAGISVDANALNAIQLAPGVKFIGNFNHGWQPYAGVNMVWNLFDDTKFRANDVALPNLSVDPYFQYGVGLQKVSGERFTGFLQAMFRAGGRTGVGLQFGFRASL